MIRSSLLALAVALAPLAAAAQSDGLVADGLVADGLAADGVAAAADQTVPAAAGETATPADETVVEGPLVLATGDPQGIYFPVGRAIAAVSPVPIEVIPTTGSTENLVRLGVGEADLAIAQTDRLRQYVVGLPPYFDGAPGAEHVRVVAALFPEPLVILARADEGIAVVEDLIGHRVNLGPGRNPTGRLFGLVLDAYSVGDDDIEIAAVPLSEQVEALCGGLVDAIAFVAAHPSGTVFQAANACAMTAVRIDGPPAERLMDENGDLAAATIPGGLYPGIEEPVATVGPMAALIASPEVPASVIAGILAALADHQPDLAAAHPSLEAFSAAAMDTALTGEVHPGAVAALADAQGE
ncbi:MAG: TAXI family TRAP transporter solute-binding subunit [Azospirillaceae bacterium]